MKQQPLVGVIMGSDSDLPTMKLAADVLAEFGVPHEVRVVSAHRTPVDMAKYAQACTGAPMPRRGRSRRNTTPPTSRGQ